MMKHSFELVSLMLICAILFNLVLTFEAPRAVERASRWRLAARDQVNQQPTTDTDSGEHAISPCHGVGCIAAYPHSKTLPCALINGTKIVAGANNKEWTILCDFNFLAQDIYPFILAGSFEECLKYCDDYNNGDHDQQCAGFVFAPDRIDLENDCYLKSSIDDSISPSTIHLVGATLIPKATPTSTPSAGPTESKDASNIQNAADGYQMPSVVHAKLLGTSTDKATKQYVSHQPALPVKLAATLLQPGINPDLINKFPLAANTGSWTEANLPWNFELANLTTPPSLSRDGGKGGNINGTHIFYFCDTSTFGDTEGPLGYMNGFVSSSAAVDISRRALGGEPLELEGPIGQWQDDVGRLRGWIPLTTGEESFNVAISGEGYRYAVWPESSFIPLNQTHSLIYAPIVYVEVDMKNQHAVFTSLGNTLVAVTVDTLYGPHADRLVKQLFVEDEVEWGSLGGLRAWTESGQGTNDGFIYLFGGVFDGILVAKVPATGITDRSAYTYWNGTAWSANMPSKDSTAYFIGQPVMDFDIAYSPRHATFFMIYLTPFADNTFYIRWLQRTTRILPPYMPGGSDDYVENILHLPWSDPMVLYSPDVPVEGYIYAGGCHFGYFGDEDLANGGTKLLITWTEHTKKDPQNPSSGYAHKSVMLIME